MSRKQTEPLELEVMPVHEIELRKFIVTAYSVLPADHLKDEPQIREEIEACSGSAAGLQMMRMHRHPSYFYVKVVDITPAKKRHRHSDNAIEEEIEE
jgi:hypothetical protein